MRAQSKGTEDESVYRPSVSTGNNLYRSLLVRHGHRLADFFASALAFATHAILPFVLIDCQLDLESTTAFLAERNAWIETAKKTVRVVGHMNFAASDGTPLV